MLQFSSRNLESGDDSRTTPGVVAREVFDVLFLGVTGSPLAGLSSNSTVEESCPFARLAEPRVLPPDTVAFLGVVEEALLITQIRMRRGGNGLEDPGLPSSPRQRL
jgi:hypothetical protein